MPRSVVIRAPFGDEPLASRLEDLQLTRGAFLMTF